MRKRNQTVSVYDNSSGLVWNFGGELFRLDSLFSLPYYSYPLSIYTHLWKVNFYGKHELDEKWSSFSFLAVNLEITSRLITIRFM